MVIVLSGLPGTGKSAIADGIGRALRISVLSVDPIESAIVDAVETVGTNLATALAYLARTPD